MVRAPGFLSEEQLRVILGVLKAKARALRRLNPRLAEAYRKPTWDRIMDELVLAASAIRDGGPVQVGPARYTPLSERSVEVAVAAGNPEGEERFIIELPETMFKYRWPLRQRLK